MIIIAALLVTVLVLAGVLPFAFFAGFAVATVLAAISVQFGDLR